MHELSIVQNVVRSAQQFAEDNEIKHVEKLVMEVGAFTGVIPQYLHMYYEEVCMGTRLEGSTLEVEEREAECFCRNCGNVYNPASVNDPCPKCHDQDAEILHGEELLIKTVSYKE